MTSFITLKLVHSTGPSWIFNFSLITREAKSPQEVMLYMGQWSGKVLSGSRADEWRNRKSFPWSTLKHDEWLQCGWILAHAWSYLHGSHFAYTWHTLATHFLCICGSLADHLMVETCTIHNFYDSFNLNAGDCFHDILRECPCSSWCI